MLTSPSPNARNPLDVSRFAAVGSAPTGSSPNLRLGIPSRTAFADQGDVNDVSSLQGNRAGFKG